MANDNQTALMMSIQRKKERVKELYRDIATHPSSRMRNISKGMLRAIQEEIAYDEKLLAVEREQWTQAYVSGRSDQQDQMSPGEWKGDDFIFESAEMKFNEKYGTDGK